MALIQRSAPDDARASFVNIIGPQPPGPAQPLYTLPVYVLGLNSLAQGIVTRDAKPVGWQFLTTGPGGAISGDVPGSASGGRPPASSRSQGPTFKKALAAYGFAERLDQVIANEYEPRALRIPLLHIEALWLRKRTDQFLSEQLDSDLVVPFNTF